MLRRPEGAEPALLQLPAELGRAHRVVREENRRSEVHGIDSPSWGPRYGPHTPNVRHAPAEPWRASILLANAPALVHVAMSVDRRYLERGGVGTSLHLVDAGVDGHLALVAAAPDGARDHAAVEAVALRDPQHGEDRRRHVHVAGRHVDR